MRLFFVSLFMLLTGCVITVTLPNGALYVIEVDRGSPPFASPTQTPTLNILPTLTPSRTPTPTVTSTIVPTFTPSPQRLTILAGTNVRASASTASSIVVFLTANTEAFIISSVVVSPHVWYNVSFRNITGWVRNDRVQLIEPAPTREVFPNTIKLPAQGYASRNTNSTKILVLTSETPYRILGVNQEFISPCEAGMDNVACALLESNPANWAVENWALVCTITLQGDCNISFWVLME